jgi:hypothetical protein
MHKDSPRPSRDGSFGCRKPERPDIAAITVLGEVELAPSRERGRPAIRLWRGTCPYCGTRHTHGLGYADEPIRPYLGLRGPHCAVTLPPPDYRIALTADELAGWSK